ncbi:hypothetical protein ACQKCU_15525 [Heyndrickxia sporothermodurans]
MSAFVVQKYFFSAVRMEFTTSFWIISIRHAIFYFILKRKLAD